MSILTLIIVQTVYSFIKNDIQMPKFVISIIMEFIFVFVIIKVYDEIGCKWENIKVVPIAKKQKGEVQPTVQNNYYYSNSPKFNTTRFCPNCGITVTKHIPQSDLEKDETIPRFCRNCGSLINETKIHESNK
jgi:hypothetical protein